MHNDFKQARFSLCDCEVQHVNCEILKAWSWARSSMSLCKASLLRLGTRLLFQTARRSNLSLVLHPLCVLISFLLGPQVLLKFTCLCVIKIYLSLFHSWFPLLNHRLEFFYNPRKALETESFFAYFELFKARLELACVY